MCDIKFYKKEEKGGKIVPFDEDFYNQMSKTYFNCAPMSFHIKYLRPIMPPGKCYDRSLYMFFCFEDAILVRGDNKDLEMKYGKENAGHGWIEIGDYVYDPSTLLRFDKELYSKLYEPTNVDKCNIEEYCSISENRKVYESIKNTKIEDYQPNGSKRIDLLTTIPLLKCLADTSRNEEFKRDMDLWLEQIQYDEEQISLDLDEKIKRLTKTNNT